MIDMYIINNVQSHLSLALISCEIFNFYPSA